MERLRRIDEGREEGVDVHHVDDREATSKSSLRSKLLSIAFRSGQGGTGL